MAEGDIRSDVPLKDIRDDWGTIGATRGLPNGVSPMDVDGMIELNEHFLFIERSSHPSALTSGQRTALKRLSKQPNTTVWLIVGPKNTFPSIIVLRAGRIEERFDLSSLEPEQQWQIVAFLKAQFTVSAGRLPRDPTSMEA